MPKPDTQTTLSPEEKLARGRALREAQTTPKRGWGVNGCSKDSARFSDFSFSGWVGKKCWVDAMFKNSLRLYETKKDAKNDGHMYPTKVKVTIKQISTRKTKS